MSQLISNDRARLSTLALLGKLDHAGQVELARGDVALAVGTAFHPDHSGNKGPLQAMHDAAKTAKTPFAAILVTIYNHILNSATSHSLRCKEAKQNGAPVPDWNVPFGESMSYWQDQVDAFFAADAAKKAATAAKAAETREARKAEKEAEKASQEEAVRELRQKAESALTLPDLLEKIRKGDAAAIGMAQAIATALAAYQQAHEPAKPRTRSKKTAMA